MFPDQKFFVSWFILKAMEDGIFSSESKKSEDVNKKEVEKTSLERQQSHKSTNIAPLHVSI